MQALSRFALGALLALATCFGAGALVGCGGSASSQDASASAASAASAQAASSDAAGDDASGASSDEADDEDQDNCYGDDLPAKKS